MKVTLVLLMLAVAAVHTASIEYAQVVGGMEPKTHNSDMDKSQCIYHNAAGKRFDLSKFNSAGPHKFVSHGKTYYFNACGDLSSVNIAGCRSNAAVCVLDNQEHRALTAGTTDFSLYFEKDHSLHAVFSKGDLCKDAKAGQVSHARATVRFSCCKKLGETEFRIDSVNGTECSPIIDVKTGAACRSHSHRGGDVSPQPMEDHDIIPMVNIIFACIFYLLLSFMACACCIACCCRRKKMSKKLSSAPAVVVPMSSAPMHEMNGYVYHPAPVVALEQQPQIPVLYGYPMAAQMPMDTQSSQMINDEMLARQLQAQFDQQNA